MLPSSVDYIFLGSSPCNTYIASVCARIGKSVVVIDRDSAYGSWSTSHNLTSFQNWHKNLPTSDDDFCHFFHPFSINESILSPVPDSFSTPQFSKSFSIDIIPLVHPCGSRIIDFFTKSLIHNYLSFQEPGPMVYFNSKFEPLQLPLSKKAVFQAKISPREKRNLVKLIDDLIGFEGDDVSVSDFLSSYQLPESLVSAFTNYLPYFTSSSPQSNLMVHNFKNSVQKFISGVGRFGPDFGLVFNRYGSSEVSQSFVRQVAVHGGLTLTNCHVSKLIEDQNSISIELPFELEDGGSRAQMSFQKLIIDVSQFPSFSNRDYFPISSRICRCVVFSNTPIKISDQILTTFCFDYQTILFFGFQYDFSKMKCSPQGVYMVHFWTHFDHDDVILNIQSKIDCLIQELKTKFDFDPFYSAGYIQNCFENNLIDHDSLIVVNDCPIIPSLEKSFELSEKVGSLLVPDVEFPF
ncbi:hypothetical protein RCL1_002872 [Eukaryota sp. TZLM3-RCL]